MISQTETKKEENAVNLPEAKFSDMKINPKILKKLEELKFTVPTPIQLQTIPVGLEGGDLIGIAQTGTGKTLAFGIPIIQKIMDEKQLALIVLPTRELALQVDEVFQKVGRSLGITTAVLIGGAAFGPQMAAIRRHPQVIIGTPGRIIDHLEKRHIKLHACRILVLDEADRMLDMGFAPQIKEILKEMEASKDRQTLLFSATMPDDIAAIATKYMKTPLRVEVARAGSVAENIEQEIYFVKKDQKLRLLEKLLQEHTGSVLVFSRTKYGAQKICKELEMSGYTAAEIHSNRSLMQRRQALDGFKTGKYRVLVATDIASRGIDVTGIQLIVNFDLPESPEDYVHRIGRTGRAGQKGRAISIATSDQQHKIYRIEMLTKTKMKVFGEAKDLPRASQGRSHPSEQRHFFKKRQFRRGSGGANRGRGGAPSGGR
ncbi:MAG: DEAD/DEAH box helicase [Candidatus Peregrinibacteria bacterium]|nr:DEAD/DEAH box helicase [Candidatus Peregrinibacteria bacterium]